MQCKDSTHLLEDKVGITTTNTLDGGDGEHDVPLTINVGVHHTQNVLERWGNNQRHSGSLEKMEMYENLNRGVKSCKCNFVSCLVITMVL